MRCLDNKISILITSDTQWRTPIRFLSLILANH